VDFKETLDRLAQLVSLEVLVHLVSRVLRDQRVPKVQLASLDHKDKLETSVCKVPRVLPDRQVPSDPRDSEGHRAATDPLVLKVPLGHKGKLDQPDIKDPWDHRAHLVRLEGRATLVLPETGDTTVRLVLLEPLVQQGLVVHRVTRVSMDRLDPQVPPVQLGLQVRLVNRDLPDRLAQRVRKERRDLLVQRDQKAIQDIPDKEE